MPCPTIQERVWPWQSQIGRFFPKRPIFPYVCVAFPEQPSNISTLGDASQCIRRRGSRYFELWLMNFWRRVVSSISEFVIRTRSPFSGPFSSGVGRYIHYTVARLRGEFRPAGSGSIFFPDPYQLVNLIIFFTRDPVSWAGSGEDEKIGSSKLEKTEHEISKLKTQILVKGGVKKRAIHLNWI